jgi:hypothetical protein
MLAKHSIAQEHGIKLVLGGPGLTRKLGILNLLKFSTFIKKWLRLFKLLYPLHLPNDTLLFMKMSYLLLGNILIIMIQKNIFLRKV